jgi:hypothetical protein
MMRTIALSLTFCAVLLALISPVMVAHAASSTTSGKIILDNPLGKNKTFVEVLNSIFKALRNILFAVVPIMVVIGAFQMMFAQGDPEKFASGQKTIIYSIIGLVVVLLAYGIVAIVQSILTV